ncbi:hypothetical protein FTUN_5268 [Frigoriglobus tundricola]|uniref:Uncharacterized protein n=1 Tax=Frigoriglobus tundricola TaxID=2774151 RepID=A0A6M5YWM1_9BACT|nr:hypothetical protein FTUN_5268 [Frigoriglobus tundricola]
MLSARLVRTTAAEHHFPRGRFADTRPNHTMPKNRNSQPGSQIRAILFDGIETSHV